MKFAIDLPNFGPYSDPRTMAELARTAEDSGWDGVFIWDHIQAGWPEKVGDTTVMLAAIACATSRVRFGPMVTPLARRNPWKVAREAVTLDHLSDGRFVLGAGLGGDWFTELSTFGVPANDATRAEMLDESLTILVGLWSGEPFSFEGKHYRVMQTQFLPAPVQSRIPIWIAGTWPRPRPFRRAARYDGVVPISADIEKDLTAEETRAILKFIRRHRTSDAPFDLVHSGITGGRSRQEDHETVAPFIEAGATWWFEAPIPWRSTFKQVRDRIRFGPPCT